MSNPVIRAEHLNVDYRLDKRWLNAIKDVSLTIDPLEIHGLVGESGSGKSTLALTLMNYLAPNQRVSSGRVLLDGDDLLTKSTPNCAKSGGAQISLVPQDALASLNPSYNVGDQIAEITRLHEGFRGASRGRAPSICCAASKSPTPKSSPNATRINSAAGCSSASPLRWRSAPSRAC